MNIRNLLSLSLLLAATAGFAQDSAQSELKLDLLPNEAWWGGAVTLGTKMPYGVAPIDINLDGDNRGNQYAPLLVSSKGRYVWCEKAFRFAFKDKTLRVTSAGNTFRYGQAGQNLRDAYRHAAKSFFPTDGKLPDRALFATPQYNTWIELMYDQNQRDVLKYAHAIVDNGLPPGVLMIDDNWQEDYGKWTFHPGRFPDPKAMMNELHALGFKVMVWVCPFVSPDCDVYRALAKKKAFFMDQPGDPAMVKWWNGKSAMLDLSNPAAKTWFTGELTRLQTTYGVDGFKLDAGDTDVLQSAVSRPRETRRQRARPAVRRDRSRLSAQRVSRHVEARGPAARATPPRQEPQLGRPRTTHPRHDRRRADGLHVCLSRHDRRRRIHLLPRSGDH